MKDINRLELPQTLALNKAIADNLETFNKQRFTQKETAAFCSDLLGFQVTISNIRNICKAAGYTWESPRKATPTLQREITDLKKQIEYLYSQLNVQLPADFPGWG